MASYGRPSYRGERGKETSQGELKSGRGRGLMPRAWRDTKPHSKYGRMVGRGEHRGGKVAAVSHSVNSGSLAPDSKRSKVTPSAETMARVAAIRESGGRHLEGMSGSESEEEEEEMECSELVRNTLKRYYHDLSSSHGESDTPSKYTP